MVFTVIWKQENKDGVLSLYSKDFKNKNDAYKHINRLRDSASRIGKELKIIGLTKLDYDGPIDSKGYKVKKGKGWYSNKMGHSVARKGVKVRKGD